MGADVHLRLVCTQSVKPTIDDKGDSRGANDLDTDLNLPGDEHIIQ